MQKDSRILVVGATKIIGAAIVRALVRHGYTGLIDLGTEPDWTDQTAVRAIFEEHKPEYLFIAGGKSGGISINQKQPATLMIDNWLMEGNVISMAHEFQVQKLLYLASSCIYPKECAQPMKEDALQTGPLEPTNEAYAMAKLGGLVLCQSYRKEYGDDFIAAIPANYFGTGDDFSPENSHVIGALITKMHAAKEANAEQVEVWGTGKPRREFIFVDDLAEASLLVMDEYSEVAPINLGPGGDLSIGELARQIKEVVGFTGELNFDTTKPDGMMRKELDSTRLGSMGWKPGHTFKQALEKTYAWYLESL